MITLHTTLYFKNKYDLLDENNRFYHIKYDIITEKMIGINNAEIDENDLNKIKYLSEKFNVEFYFVKDNTEEAKNFFKLDISENTLGYYYTIQYFSAILKCKTNYLFHYAPDIDFEINDDYLLDSIKLLDSDDKVVTTTILWCDDRTVGKLEEEYSDRFFKTEKNVDNFDYTLMFSDQYFITKIDKIKKCDFNLYHIEGEKYPRYGGNCFEKRLACDFHNNRKYRAVYNKYRYYHSTKYR